MLFKDVTLNNQFSRGKGGWSRRRLIKKRTKQNINLIKLVKHIYAMFHVVFNKYYFIIFLNSEWIQIPIILIIVMQNVIHYFNHIYTLLFIIFKTKGTITDVVLNLFLF